MTHHFDAQFDGQKLGCHPVRVAEWLERGLTQGPIYTEIGISNRCNCNCQFCGVDFEVNRTGDFMDAALARRIVDGLQEIGNKSLLFSGDGEPLLNPQASTIIPYASTHMSTALTTNGVKLSDNNVEIVDGLKWLRLSINGGTSSDYAAVHGTRPEVFDRVLENLARVVERKRTLGLSVTVGTQLVLLNENAEHVLDLARRVRELGVDYFSVKPYSQHPLSRNQMTVDYGVFEGLEQDIKALESPEFRVIYRAGSMAKAGRCKAYGTCYGTNFMCYISANGDVWECNIFVNDPRFAIGCAAHTSLRDIWNGPRRREVLAFIANELDLKECRDICRMDECNRYLWRLKHPMAHDDFI